MNSVCGVSSLRSFARPISFASILSQSITGTIIPVKKSDGTVLGIGLDKHGNLYINTQRTGSNIDYYMIQGPLVTNGNKKIIINPDSPNRSDDCSDGVYVSSTKLSTLPEGSSWQLIFYDRSHNKVGSNTTILKKAPPRGSGYIAEYEIKMTK